MREREREKEREKINFEIRSQILKNERNENRQCISVARTIFPENLGFSKNAGNLVFYADIELLL